MTFIFCIWFRSPVGNAVCFSFPNKDAFFYCCFTEYECFTAFVESFSLAWRHDLSFSSCSFGKFKQYKLSEDQHRSLFSVNKRPQHNYQLTTSTLSTHSKPFENGNVRYFFLWPSSRSRDVKARCLTSIKTWRRSSIRIIAGDIIHEQTCQKAPLDQGFKATGCKNDAGCCHRWFKSGNAASRAEGKTADERWFREIWGREKECSIVVDWVSANREYDRWACWKTQISRTKPWAEPWAEPWSEQEALMVLSPEWLAW